MEWPNNLFDNGNENNENMQKVLQTLNDNDLVLISMALASQIREYQNLGWHKEKAFQERFERMKTIHACLKSYEDSMFTD